MLGSLNLSMGRQGGSPEGSIVAELRFLVQQGSATGMKICQTNLFYESHLMETALIAAIHFTLVTDALLTVLDVLLGEVGMWQLPIKTETAVNVTHVYSNLICDPHNPETYLASTMSHPDSLTSSLS